MNTSTGQPGVIGRIARLPDTKYEDIKTLWQQLFATPLPTYNRQYLERRIAYRMQELEFAKREPGLLERNKARIDALIEITKPKAKAGRGEVVIVFTPQIVQCTGRQTKPVSGMLGGEEGGSFSGNRAVGEHSSMKALFGRKVKRT